MPRVLIAGRLHDSGLAHLRARDDLQIDYVEDVAPEVMAPHLARAEAVLLRTQPLQASQIAAAPALAIVSRHGVGYDAVDVGALSARNVPLTIVGDVNAQTVAEHAMMLMLAASRRLPDYMAGAGAGGNWNIRNGLSAREISGKTLLIIGLGRVGRRLARMAQGFGIRVEAHDPYLSGAPPEGVRLVDDLAAALARADLVSLHLPGTEAPVLGAAELARLKPSAVIVNTARGGAVDERALAQALSAGRLHGAGIDVFGQEPPGPDSPLVKAPHVVRTPHCASMTLECAERMAFAAARNITDFFDGRLDRALVVNAAEIGL